MQKDNLLKERTSRLKAIKKLIKNNRIKSQEELLGLLTNEGYEVTQATLSRDLNILSSHYNIDFVQPYDMFPQTHQIETLVSLSCKK